MEEEIISKEFIKPSSPTPSDKKIYKLSLLDQIAPPIFIPIILYFPATTRRRSTPESISLTTHSLKQSLSTTLSHFYPFAGRIKDSLSISCNDDGMLFVVAKHGYTLSDFLKNPDSAANAAASLAHIPAPITWDEPGPGDEVAMVKVNHFDCGGVAVGFLFLHKLTDGASMATFMKSWAAAARGCSPAVLPDYSPRALFPCNETMQRDMHTSSSMRRYFRFGKTMTRRYVFEAASISKLRDGLILIIPQPEQRRPTRVEAVSAFLWKCFMLASAAAGGGGGGSGDSVSTLVSHGVNMRGRAEPALPEHSFGNYIWIVPAAAESGEGGDLKVLFGKVREAIGRVDAEFIGRMGGEMGFSGYCRNHEETQKGFVERCDYLSIVSWCNFGFYEVNFGWGRPAWVSKGGGGGGSDAVECPFLNMVLLNDTPERDGVEACVTVDERLFVEMEKIKELRDLALSDPSPLQIAAINPLSLSDE